MWKCPKCENEIDDLDFSVQTREWGNVSLLDPENENSECDENGVSNYETSDSEWTGDVCFSCPECSEEIELGELIPVMNDNNEEEKQEEKKLEEEKFNIIAPQKNLQTNRNNNTDQIESIMICKHCLHVFVYSDEKYGNGDEDMFFDCPSCGLQNSKKEYKELIATRHYEKIKIKRIKKYAKKTKSRRLQPMDRAGRSVCSAV